MTQTGDGHRWSGRAPAGRVAYVNGRYVPHGRAAVHIEDRGLQFSDAVYEVFGVIEGVIFDEEEHLDRLERSLGELEIAMPMQRTAMKFVVREVARRNGVGNGLIYMQITRGAYRRDHPIPADQFVRPSIIMTARNMDMVSVEARRQSGVSVVTGRDERWGRCDIKSTSLLANILAKTAGRRAGAYETWLVDSEGFVTEGSSTTAWIVDKDGRVVTRNLSHAILPGVTRKVILEAAAEAQLPVEERRFTPAEAANAKEAFISAASIGAVPVVSVDGKTVGDGRSGPVCRRIQELYRIKAASRAVSSESL